MNKPIPHFTLEHDREGLTCDVSGVTLAGTPLLAKNRAGFAPRPTHELDLLLTAAHGGRLDARALNRGLAVAADALNDGDVRLAMIGALHLRLPPIDERAAARLAKVDELLEKYNYNPEDLGIGEGAGQPTAEALRLPKTTQVCAGIAHRLEPMSIPATKH